MADAAMLSESDAAFYSFVSVMLCLYIVPSALYTAFRVFRQPKKLLQSTYFTANAVGLAVAIAALLRCLQMLQNVDTSGMFDPYEILRISESASLRDIRKAYRRLGKELHPDKNPNNRTAAALFRRVTKAYEALTDAKGIENYRKFGHPDGPQSKLLDFAFLSAFTGGGGSGSALFVLVYFGLIFGVIAFVVYSLHKSSGRRDRTQVSRRTAAVLLESFHEKMGLHDIVELLLSSDEMKMTAGGEADVQEAIQRSKAHDKILKKMESVKALPADILTRIKKHPDPIARYARVCL
jgi:preprotein translocase subunit Sec63